MIEKVEGIIMDKGGGRRLIGIRDKIGGLVK